MSSAGKDQILIYNQIKWNSQMYFINNVSFQSMLFMTRKQKKSLFMETRILKWLIHSHFPKSCISNLVQFKAFYFTSKLMVVGLSEASFKELNTNTSWTNNKTCFTSSDETSSINTPYLTDHPFPVLIHHWNICVTWVQVHETKPFSAWSCMSATKSSMHFSS